MRREQSGGGSGYGSGSESSTSAATIPDVVRTRPTDYSGTDYGTISRAISGAKVVQIMENRSATPQAPPPPPPPPPQGKHSGSERSVTFSPSAKRPADMTTYDTFGKPRRSETGEPRYSAGPGSRRPLSGGSADLLTNGRLSPPLPPPPPEARQIDEAYGTLGSSSCSTLASGGTASSGSSGSVVTVIAAGPGGAGYDPSAGGSMMRRQLGRQTLNSGSGGTLPTTKKEGRGASGSALSPK